MNKDIPMFQNTRQTRILFVCVENAGRSQMAEAFARKRGLEAGSAGTVPSSKVNPVAVIAMQQKGIDLSASRPKVLTAEMIDRTDLAVTTCCSVEQRCPRPMLAKMQKKLLDWNLEDPKGKPLEEVSKIRDEIERRVVQLSKASSLKVSRVRAGFLEKQRVESSE